MNGYKKWWLIALGLALLMVTVSPLASGSPDGLEKVAEQQGFAETTRAAPFQVIADYIFPGVENKALATILAGWIGVLTLFGAVYTLSWLLARHRNNQAPRGNNHSW
ncbi:PDGLE domain-containing protein [Dehalogenimonas sp. THU2]|uniref:PDGLE domain-containing protein n=1 Tax=Dehalogenimonas sp. THU2 TaxID=3151121 RepID=UPI003218C9DD